MTLYTCIVTTVTVDCHKTETINLLQTVEALVTTLHAKH